MEAAIVEAQEALDRSSDQIAKQESDYKKLLTLCVVLGIALAVDGVATLVVSLR